MLKSCLAKLDMANRGTIAICFQALDEITMHRCIADVDA